MPAGEKLHKHWPTKMKDVITDPENACLQYAVTSCTLKPPSSGSAVLPEKPIPVLDPTPLPQALDPAGFGLEC